MMTKTRTISNSDDMIDSRDVIARIAELEGDREAIAEEWTNRAEYPDTVRIDPELLTLAEWDEGDDGQELKALLALQEEAEGYASDWRHGAALIRDSYFETYAQDLAEDMYGQQLSKAHWPFDQIDWEAAADALKADYTSVDYDGVEYWVRS